MNRRCEGGGGGGGQIVGSGSGGEGEVSKRPWKIYNFTDQRRAQPVTSSRMSSADSAPLLLLWDKLRTDRQNMLTLN